MSKMIQIRNVPDEMHQRIKSRASLAGLSMSDFVLQELRKGLERPTRQVLIERLSAYEELALDPDPAALVREERDRA